MVSTGPMPKAIEAEFHISMQAALSACGRAWPPHSPAATARSSRPRPSRGRLLPAGRRGDVAVLERRAELVADRVERRDHSVAKRPASSSTASTSSAPSSPPCASVREGRRVLERKGDVGDRRAVGHRVIHPCVNVPIAAPVAGDAPAIQGRCAVPSEGERPRTSRWSIDRGNGLCHG